MRIMPTFPEMHASTEVLASAEMAALEMSPATAEMPPASTEMPTPASASTCCSHGCDTETRRDAHCD
jgi:hypothetical protein